MKRRIALSLALFVLLLGSLVYAQGYKYESHFDPFTAATWKKVHSEPVLTPMGVCYVVYVENPDVTAPVRFAAMLLTPSGGLICYAYICDCKMYFCSWDDPSKTFKLSELEEEVLDKHWKNFEAIFGISRNQKGD